jgi:MFS family permease
MSFAAFLLFLALGAALLAAWVIDRFPERSPNQLRQALIHFTISLALVWAAPNVVGPFAAGGPLAAVAAVFLLLLPPLVYAWLSAAWVLRLLHEAIEH